MGRLGRQGLDGLRLRLDADVLDAAVMPAVDSPHPGGPARAGPRSPLRVPSASERRVGVEATVFEPDPDSEGRPAGAFA